MENIICSNKAVKYFIKAVSSLDCVLVTNWTWYWLTLMCIQNVRILWLFVLKHVCCEHHACVVLHAFCKNHHAVLQPNLSLPDCFIFIYFFILNVAYIANHNQYCSRVWFLIANSIMSANSKWLFKYFTVWLQIFIAEIFCNFCNCMIIKKIYL